ncbi:MAG: hypothetical protein Q7K03_09635 [Dehalococcoidia bacterium]|nr:hypothetical protein [Dehalococcoidia bacterium]
MKRGWRGLTASGFSLSPISQPCLQLISDLLGFRPVVRVMAVLKHQLAVEVHMELAVAGWHQPATADGVAVLLQDFARYPSGS